MKCLLLPPIFQRFKKSAFFSSLNQNTCPVYDAEEIKKQEQQEPIKKLLEGVVLDEERIENLTSVFPPEYLSIFEQLSKYKK